MARKQALRESTTRPLRAYAAAAPRPHCRIHRGGFLTFLALLTACLWLAVQVLVALVGADITLLVAVGLIVALVAALTIEVEHQREVA